MTQVTTIYTPCLEALRVTVIDLIRKPLTGLHIKLCAL